VSNGTISPDDGPAVTIQRVVEGRRDYRRHVLDLISGRRVVVYGCGMVFSRLLSTWDRVVGRPIDLCCDSDPAKWGRSCAGVPCISPEELLAMRDECAVFVAAGDFMPVFDFLLGSGVRPVNLIYKYDLVSSDYLAGADDGVLSERLEATRELLADRRSVQVFDAILERVVGQSADPLVMADVCDPDQYFPSAIVELGDEESFVDAGAYDGDTLREFVERTRGRFRRATCFELDTRNFAALRECAGGLSAAGRIDTRNVGLWDGEEDVTYSLDTVQSSVGQGREVGHVVALDDAMLGEDVTFIKMDVEGAEPRALRGASRIIRSQKPRLAVCVYHHISHLWEVPGIIHELVPEHRIYLRHHTNLEYETVCYAVP
jgi:FkbM family methyltransferase